MTYVATYLYLAGVVCIASTASRADFRDYRFYISVLLWFVVYPVAVLIEALR